MPAYDTRFTPPAPITSISISHPVQREYNAFSQGKIDTGADISVIPEHLITELRLSPRGRLLVRGFDGSSTQCFLYYVKMRIEDNDIGIVRCISAKRDHALLGRNVLNNFIILLDGPNHKFEMTLASEQQTTL